jgi:hypothetical protein
MADDAPNHPNHLLALQTLLDLCASKSNAAKDWADSVTSDTLRVAHLTIAQAKATVTRCADSGKRARLWAKLSALLSALEADGGAPLAFGRGHADVWQALMVEATIAEMPQVDRQVYAMAVHEGLVVVEYRHRYTADLAPLGVRIHCLD